MYKIEGINLNHGMTDKIEKILSEHWGDNYIFYERNYDEIYHLSSSLNYTGYCTHCREYIEFKQPKDIVSCPACDHSVKMKRMSAKYKDLGRQYFFNYGYCEKKDNSIILRIFHIKKSYHYTGELCRGEYVWDEYQRFCINENGEVSSSKNEFRNMSGLCKYSGDRWQEIKDIRNCDFEGYDVLNFDIVEKLLSNKFNIYNKSLYDNDHVSLNTNNILKTIGLINKYPAIKALYKKGYFGILSTIIHNKNLNELKLNQTQLNKILSFDVNKVKCAREEIDVAELASYRWLYKNNMELSKDNISLAGGLLSLGCSKMHEHTCQSLHVLFKYLRNQKNKTKSFNIHHYVDYIRNCEKLQYDIKQSNINKPTDLKAAHDRVSTLVVRFGNKHKQKDFANQVNSYRKTYEYFEDDKFAIIAPQTISAVVKEGRELSHCVGGYVDRIISGRSVILFVREKSDIYKRLVTLEWNPDLNKKVQNYGYKDKLPSKEVLDFISRWEKVVLKRIKRSA